MRTVIGHATGGTLPRKCIINGAGFKEGKIKALKHFVGAGFVFFLFNIAHYKSLNCLA